MRLTRVEASIVVVTGSEESVESCARTLDLRGLQVNYIIQSDLIDLP